MNPVVIICSVILTILISATLHEFGHLITARAFHIHVKEVGIGGPAKLAKIYNDKHTLYFPPQIYLFTAKGIRFVLNLLPITAYCDIAWDAKDIPKGAPATDIAFKQASKTKQIIVLLGGVTINYLISGISLAVYAKLAIDPDLMPLQLIGVALIGPMLLIASLPEMFKGEFKLTNLSSIQAARELTAQAPQLDTNWLFLMIFILNFGLFITNLLPIFGVTDGGKIFIIFLEKIFGPKAKNVISILTIIGAFIFIGILLVSCIAEIAALIS